MIYNVIKLFCSLFLIYSSAMAKEQISYKSLSFSENMASLVLPANINLFDLGSSPKPGELDIDINQHLDPKWKKPDTKLKIEMQKPATINQYAEGTGTRGGGSGLLIKHSAEFTEVQLLEIFRSHNLGQYSLFFPIDESLKIIQTSGNSQELTRLIFENVLERIRQVAPGLAGKIHHLYAVELPFEKWIPVIQDLPLIDDEVPYPLEQNKEKVQIAVRRTKYIIYNSRAYLAMTPLNQAALWLHEYLYALSGSEKSIKTQRAVSLFFSSDFSVIARDELKLTRLFFDLDLLAISRSSILSSLPPGATLANERQTLNCGRLTQIKGSIEKKSVEITMNLSGTLKTLALSTAESTIVMSSMMWAKSFLEKSYPIYKYPGQKILVDQVCLDKSQSKVVQVQSSLAIDEEMRTATDELALLESQVFKATSDYYQVLTAIDENPNFANYTVATEALEKLSELRLQRFRKQIEFNIKSLTPIEKIIHPQMLGQYFINIEY
jgi:hypothetical protein